MKKLKLFFACLLMAVLSIGQVWAVDPTISWDFKTLQTTSGTQSGITWETGKTGSATATACNSTNGLVLYGVSSGGGYFQTTSAISGTITNVNIVSANQKNTPKYTVYCSANGSDWTEIATDQTAGTKDHAVTGSYTYVKVANTTAATAQLGVASITVTYTPSGGGSTPTLSVDPTVIDFGTVEQNAVVASQTVEVSFANLTGSVTYSGLSGAFSASGSISSTGDEITIAANTANVGNYSQTLTVQSTDDSKSAEVTVKMNVVEPFDGLKLTFDFVTHPEGWPAAKASAVAGNYVYTISATDYTFAHSKVGDGIYCGGTSGSSGYLMIAKSNSLGLPAISGYKLVKVEGTLNNSGTPSTKAEITITNGTDEVTGGASQTWDEKGVAKTYNLSGTVANTMYYLNVSGTANLQMITLVLYYEEAEAPTVAAPTISGVTPFLSSTEVTLTQNDADAIYYTTDEAKKGTPDVDTWTVYNSASKPSFSETTTIYAAAIKGSAWSAVAEKTFTKATILTVAEALTIIEGLDNKTATTAEYYVSGVVSTVTALTVDGTGEYYISADGTKTSELQVYKGKWVGGANFTSTDQLIEGDDVTIKGKLKKYNSYKELDQNNEVVAYKLKARLAWSEESYEADLSSSNTYPSLTNTNGVSVSYSSSNTDAATINPSTGAISLVAVGSTTIKAAFTGNETYKANEVSYTLNVSNSVLRADISFEENGGSDVADLTDQSNLPDPLPTITKAGYNFGGWWTTSDFQAGTEAVAGAAVESTDDIVLHAKWLDPYTVTEALTMIDALADNGETGNVYVSGIVCTAPSNLISGEYLTYYISVDGTETNRLQVYKGKNVGNIAFTNKEDVQAADQVIVYGPLKKFKQGENIIPEFNTGNYLYSLSRKAEAGIEWGVASFDAYIGQSNTFPTLTNPNLLTVVYSSSNETAATIDPATGAITLGTTPNVNTTITASFAGNSSYKAAEVSYTLNVYNPTNPGTITYEENGGSEVADVTTPVDNFPDPLPTPTKENNIFAGWWTTSTFNDGTQAVAGAPMDGNVILYAKWTEIPVWAYTYTSNVTIASNEEKQVTIDGVDYAAAKTNKGTSATITLPQGVTTLHLHLVAWKSETQTVTVSGNCFNEDKNLTILANDAVSGSVAKYDLGESGVDYYFSLTPDKEVAANTVITIAAEGQKRFVLFGVNQEGGVLPVLESIEISGDLGTKTGYKVGDALDLDGLTVEATYSLGGVAQSPVDITSDPELELTYDPLVEDQTEVTITASYKGQTDDITITDLDPVASADPKIYVSTLNVNFASVEVGESVPAAETVTVTLTNVASVTATLGGTNADAFSVSSASLTESGDITISILANTDAAASYAATLTISDGEGGADDKTVNLSFVVTEPVVTEEYQLVSDVTSLAAGDQVIIVAENEGDYYTLDGSISSQYFPSTAVSIAAGIITAPSTSAIILGKDGGNWTMSMGGQLIGATAAKKASLGNGDASNTWTIAIAENVATIANTTEAYGKLQFNYNNGTNPRFLNYASVQTAVAIYKKVAAPEPTPDYTREVTNGHYGTICLPKAGTIEGATLYEIGSFENSLIYIDEVGTTLTAGVPYIFYASGAQLNVYYTDKTAADVPYGNANGLFGFYDLENENATLPLADDASLGNYILYNDQYWLVSGRAAYIANYRAYIKLGSITPKAAAPGRRRVAMAVNGENAATGFENIESGDKPVKVMIEGTMYILRGEKVYDATGRLVK